MPISAWLTLAALGFTVALQGVLFAFFLGRLFERVQALERERREEVHVTEQVIRLDEQMKHANQTLDAVKRELSGVNRQLANLVTGGGFRAMVSDPHEDRR